MRFAYMIDTHFGLYDQPMPSPGEVAAAWDHLLAEAELAEEVGFDAVFIPERHGRTETFVPDPLSVATAVAARTTRIKIATTVMMPPLHNPVALAERISLVDNLSKGRFIFGAGVGYHPGYHQTFGVPFARRGKRFEEAMEIIVKALSGERFSFHGEFYDFDDVLLAPAPYQRPRPPFWIGAHTEGKPVDRALDYDGWVLWTQPAWEHAAAWITSMRARAAERGRNDWAVVLDQDGWLGDDAPEVRARHAARWLREARFYEEHDFPAEIDPRGDIDQAEGFEHALRDFETRQMHFGTVESWVERIAAVRDTLAPDWLNIRLRGPRAEYGDYPTHEEFLTCIRRFGEDVIRRFQ
jgi:alkanesulfonate monooxygenase SsuD/methylene tetrahydromethanopterin reductase-like flavin-dependent oxidoreductase (luciferase family)